MTVNPEDDIDVDTRTFYLRGRDQPVLYVAIPPGSDPHLREASRILVPFVQSFGLPPLEVSDQGDLLISAASDGWRLLFTGLGGGDTPLMSIDWPAMPSPLVYGVRRTSPSGWAKDVIAAGRAALMVGPPLDWDALVLRLDPDGDHDVLGVEGLLAALGGREAACGMVPAVADGA